MGKRARGATSAEVPMSTVPGGSDAPRPEHLPTRCAGRRVAWTRRLRRVVLLLGGVYLGVFLVLLALERWLIFHPTAYPADWREPPSALHAQDVWLSLGNGARIHAWW